MKALENNNVQICGAIISDFNFSHESHGEKFYSIMIGVERLSGCFDFVPLLISERLIDVNGDYRGRMILANGQFRSYNRHEGTKNRLVLSIFVREWEYVEGDQRLGKTNQIFIEGYICKPPTCRKTPLGREVADLLVAVNRSYGKSDYIPCICWGRNARFASQFNVGERIQLIGRIQSREYTKKFDDGMQETRIAYEVSVSCIKVKEREVSE